MKNSGIHHPRIRLVAGLFLMAVLLAVSFGLRQASWQRTTGIQNIEASYHVLLTMKALDANPASGHFYLPIVTLGRAADKGVPWGAAIPAPNGDYVYTSFPPPGFLAPYLTLKIFGAAATPENLARFNFALGAATSLVLFLLLSRLLATLGHSPSASLGGALLGSSIAVFSKEVLQSHGLVYWSHSLSQLILAGGAWCVLRHLEQEQERGTGGKSAVFLHGITLAAFLGAWTEWSAYVFNLGLMLLFWFGFQGAGKSRSASVRIFLATAAAGVLTIVHYAMLVGVFGAMEGFAKRFLKRNTTSGSITGLLEGYGLSFGLFLLVLLGILLHRYFSARGGEEPPERQRILKFMLLATAIPLVENLVMLQHAEQFSFDRLKFIFPAAILIALFFVRQGPKARAVLAAAILLASVNGWRSYQDDLRIYAKWGLIDAGNRHLAGLVLREVDPACTVFMLDTESRGYPPLLFGRNVYEGSSVADARAVMQRRRACAAVFVESRTLDASRVMKQAVHLGDLPGFVAATVVRPDGAAVRLDLRAFYRGRFEVAPSFFATDAIWNRGLARQTAGFYVPAFAAADYTAGSSVRFADGRTRRILAVVPDGGRLLVRLDGAPLDPAATGSPSGFQVFD